MSAVTHLTRTMGSIPFEQSGAIDGIAVGPPLAHRKSVPARHTAALGKHHGPQHILAKGIHALAELVSAPAHARGDARLIIKRAQDGKQDIEVKAMALVRVGNDGRGIRLNDADLTIIAPGNPQDKIHTFSRGDRISGTLTPETQVIQMNFGAYKPRLQAVGVIYVGNDGRSIRLDDTDLTIITPGNPRDTTHVVGRGDRIRGSVTKGSKIIQMNFQ